MILYGVSVNTKYSCAGPLHAGFETFLFTDLFYYQNSLYCDRVSAAQLLKRHRMCNQNSFHCDRESAAQLKMYNQNSFYCDSVSAAQLKMYNKNSFYCDRESAAQLKMYNQTAFTVTVCLLHS